jgi:hypothetical protein
VDAVAQDWGATGLASLTGMPDGPPDFSRAAVLAEARRVTARLGLRRGGRVSPGGATRLLPARDGTCAVTLSRADDVDAVLADGRAR